MPQRAADWETNFDLFGDVEKADEVKRRLTYKPMKHPVWSEHKARLIELYLRYFVMVTKHGTYIDGFAGPQSPENPETWSAKAVLESRPRFLRHFFLCELDALKIEMLQSMVDAQPPQIPRKESKRKTEILSGDFNTQVDAILNSGVIKETEATFALLDQRTFECHWSTVQKLAQHKKVGNKIELFYFVAVKWLHRSFAGTSTAQGSQDVDAWWGSSGWGSLKKSSQFDIAIAFAKRFETELSYRFAVPHPIYGKEDGRGGIMYYMVHATDHPAAPGLMARAYNQAVMSLQKKPDQGELFTLAS
jgi:three-Cys-motif partner protein